VDIIDNLSMSNGAGITSGDAARSTRLRVYLHSGEKTLKLGSGAVLHGSFIAPGTRIQLGDNTAVQGAIYARVVQLGQAV